MTGKFCESVKPATTTLPDGSKTKAVPTSSISPPSSVDQTNVLPFALMREMMASLRPARVTP